MSRGFLHPVSGYWQTISEPTEAMIAAYPEGTVEVPLKPGADFEWDGEAWLASEPPPPPVPVSVSRFQARAALHNAGLLTAVEAAVAAADPFTQIAWADATEFRRDSPTIAALAVALGMTGAQLDDLFRAAALIVA